MAVVWLIVLKFCVKVLRCCNMTKNIASEIILYTAPDGTIKIDTICQDETIWLTQKKMAALFGVKRPAITKHLKNIFESGELDKKVVGSILEHTTQHGAMAGKNEINS